MSVTLQPMRTPAFDWDEARRLRAEGLTYEAIGASRVSFLRSDPPSCRARPEARGGMTDQHSIHVDYTTVGNHIHLKLERSDGGHYSVTDPAGRLYFPPASMETCVRFMRAFAARHPGTVLDEESIERLGREPQATVSSSGQEPVVSQAGDFVASQPASRPSNVTPLRRATEPYGDSA